MPLGPPIVSNIFLGNSARSQGPHVLIQAIEGLVFNNLDSATDPNADMGAEPYHRLRAEGCSAVQGPSWPHEAPSSPQHLRTEEGVAIQ